ncbi:MAG TPA: RNA degradosome polyphosphate kinase [Acidimicrobiia bacterium]|nr:RNA degradosome polyphosphate kinase [Acidimicrobiia bacterium]
MSDDPGKSRYLDRELSWLDFNGRVLALAEDRQLPLLERVKFLAIFSRNLDEFFMIRVAGLADRAAAGLGAAATGGLDPAAELASIRRRVDELVLRQTAVFRDDVQPRLAGEGIRLSDWAALSSDHRKELGRYFEDQIFPVLTPLSVDPGHPFPYISNLSLNLAIMVRDPDRAERRFARVKVPPLLPRFVAAADGSFVPLEQVIAAHLDRLFPGMEIELHCPFRVTRNADLSVADEESDDLLATIEMELRRRRFGHAVRLEIHPGMPDEIRDLLVRELDLTPDNVYEIDGLLDLDRLWEFYATDRPDLKDPPWPAVVPPRLAGVEEGTVDIFAVLAEKGVLVHHPYDSFADSVLTFIRQAALDPQVLAIKQTLYRTSGDSPIVKALIRAAERGKQVAVLVELKARFDEEANIGWARALEQAGVHVVYGLVGLKTHSKTALVVRSEPAGIRRYCHVGTGNYNPTTAKLYEDIGIMTADPDLGADLSDLFNYLTGYSRSRNFRKILIAPLQMRDRIIELIDETAAGDGGRIVMKMNALVDERVIDALYAASAAGTEIDLIIRGICRLRPETPGLSERIRVRSVLGRYLEHSRIYAFGNTGRQMRYWIGSADMMPRNLDGRVEVLAPVEDPDLAARLQEILDVNLSDGCRTWRLSAEGHWNLEGGEDDVQARLAQLAADRSAGRS